MNKVYIVALEPLPTRYTGEWLTELPGIIRQFSSDPNIEIETVYGDILDIPNTTTPGAFLNFTATNKWKSHQVIRLAEMFNDGILKSGDKLLFLDAWHPGIINTKYMSELTGINVEIHSIWHAGSYDPQDFLGRCIIDKKWSFNFERAVFHASDKNYFATKFHLDMMLSTLELKSYRNKAFVVGLPFDYLKRILVTDNIIPKENIILFPHRVSEEKQPDIFKDLEKSLPEYKFIICQEGTPLTKNEYHNLLHRSKLVFSANLQETLGISMYEGLLTGCSILVPDRLSYSEMYKPGDLYPSDYTITHNKYVKNKDKLISLIKYKMESYPNSNDNSFVISKLDKFFSGKELVNQLLS